MLSLRWCCMGWCRGLLTRWMLWVVPACVSCSHSAARELRLLLNLRHFATMYAHQALVGDAKGTCTSNLCVYGRLLSLYLGTDVCDDPGLSPSP